MIATLRCVHLECLKYLHLNGYHFDYLIKHYIKENKKCTDYINKFMF